MLLHKLDVENLFPLSLAGWRAAESTIKLGRLGIGHLKLHCFTPGVL